MPIPDNVPLDDDTAVRLAQLRRERDEVQASLPKHSVSAALLIRLEDLEEQIAALEAAYAVREDDPPAA